MCKPSLFQKWSDILWLGGNLHNVGKLVSYLHIVVLALELSIFKEHFKMYAKMSCSWTSVISYPFGTHIRGLLNLWLPHNTASMTMINSLNRHHRKIIKSSLDETEIFTESKTCFDTRSYCAIMCCQCHVSWKNYFRKHRCASSKQSYFKCLCLLFQCSRFLYCFHLSMWTLQGIRKIKLMYHQLL